MLALTRRSSFVSLAAAVAAGCAGPQQGFLAEFRARTALLAEAEEAEPPPLECPPHEGIAAFPLFYSEHTGRREVLEVLWPFFERACSSRSSYLRARPFVWSDHAPDRDALIVFPFYWSLNDRRENGERRLLHVWPFFGIEERPIDLAPATTYSTLWPIAALRLGEGRWRARLWPILDLSSGYLDRGWWLVPLLKAGTGPGGWSGGNRFFHLLDPLFTYTRFSIAGGRRAEEPEDTRTEVMLLGGLLGWERSGGRTTFRLFWFRL